MMSSRSNAARQKRHRLALGEVVVALGAIAGAAGLVAGSIDLGNAINNRSTLESPAFAGGALFAIIGIPMTFAAIAALQGAGRRNHLAMAAEALLMGWIAVEIVVIRSFCCLRPAFLILGVAIAFAGYRNWQLTWGA